MESGPYPGDIKNRIKKRNPYSCGQASFHVLPYGI